LQDLPGLLVLSDLQALWGFQGAQVDLEGLELQEV